MRQPVKTITGGMLAGICISIGGTAYLSIENPVIGALFFTVGLYAICALGLLLYTGKIGYVAEGTVRLSDTGLIWAGNLLGTWLTALALRCTRVSTRLAERAAVLAAVKTEDSVWSLLVLGIFCGLLVFVAVDGFRQHKQPLILFAGVAGFILCGFEHCVADMFYFAMADVWTLDALWRILLITLGNSIGGLLIPLWRRFSAQPAGQEQKPA